LGFFLLYGESFVMGVDCPVKNKKKVKIKGEGVFLLKVQIEK